MTLDANLLLQAASHAAAGQQYPKGALYLVATPIGNLADLTLRAIHVLALADIVACEDTRVTARLLQHLGLDKRLMSVHQHNEAQSGAEVIDALQQGLRVAYVSDAGTPAVSDPGAHLVSQVQAAGLRAVPIPGVSSSTTALSVSGDTQSATFHFVGFLPAKGAQRAQALEAALGWSGSIVLAGCEAHVCLLQTALDLIEEEFEVWVVTDACTSRFERDRDAAFDRLASAGAELLTTEMVLFEWLRDSQHPAFKNILALIK